MCKTKGKRDIKVYLLLFTCSLTRAVHFEILPNQTTQEFIQALKRLIATRGRPKVIYSDNAKTFERASKWMKRVYKDVGMKEFLVTEQVKWKFNLSRARKQHLQSNTYKERARRSHTGHRDKLEQSTADVCS